MTTPAGASRKAVSILLALCLLASSAPLEAAAPRAARPAPLGRGPALRAGSPVPLSLRAPARLAAPLRASAPTAAAARRPATRASPLPAPAALPAAAAARPASSAPLPAAPAPSGEVTPGALDGLAGLRRAVEPSSALSEDAEPALRGHYDQEGSRAESGDAVLAPAAGPAPSRSLLSFFGKRKAAKAAADAAESKSAREAVQALFRLRQEVQGNARQILKKEMGGDLGDGELHRDVQRVLRRLTRAAGLPGDAAQVFVGNSFLPNAFTTITQSEINYLKDNAHVAKAFRVSNVFINLGLLRSLESEGQLAFILAHELMHNWKGHLKDPSGMGHMMLGHFHELEADAEALKLMAAAGYDPRTGIDSLYALDREYKRLEKRYSLLKRRSNDLLESLNRIRDVHPDSDIRRAAMFENLNQALELYRPQPVPESPVWMERRKLSARPSALDRFALRLSRAVGAAGTTLREKIHGVESHIQKERAKAPLGIERYAEVEETYRKLAGPGADLGSLRPVETSVQRQAYGAFPSRKLKAGLITSQLDVLMRKGAGGGKPTLPEFIALSAGLSPATRKAGALRLIGSVRDRRELEAAFLALSEEGESVELGKTNAPVPAARRLWGAAARVLSAELGRPALPEEIIDELRAKLSPAWLSFYRPGFNVEILESAFGPAERRSSLRPSELASRLEGLADSFEQERHWTAQDQFKGIDEWSARHYQPLSLNYHSLRNGQPPVQYEKFYVDMLSSPRLEDQLDIVGWYSGGSLPAPFLRVLQREGKTEAFLSAYFQALGRELTQRLKGAATAEERSRHVKWYCAKTAAMTASAMFLSRDFRPVRVTLETIWNEVEALIATPEARAAFSDADRSRLLDTFMKQAGLAWRYAVTAVDARGGRPDLEEIRLAAALLKRIETALGLFPPSRLVTGYASELAKSLKDDESYMRMYRRALPNVVMAQRRPLPKGLRWLSRWFGWAARPYRWVASRLSKRPYALPGVPKSAMRALNHGDFGYFLLRLGDPELGPREKLMLVALLDRLDMSNYEAKDSLGRNIGLRASASVGRWLLEDVTSTPKDAAGVRRTASDMLRLGDMHPGLLQPDMETMGGTRTAFRAGARFIKRNETYRSIAKGEHPFRGVNTRWSLAMARDLDRHDAWPKKLEDRLDLLDFLASTGEFDDSLDLRVLAEAAADPKGFRRWVAHDRKRLSRMGGDSYNTIDTPMGPVPAPMAQPLRIVRNPALRVQLFRHLPESELGENAPRRKFKEWLRSSRELLSAYRAARQYFSREFLMSLRREGALEDRFFEVLEEVDRISQKRMNEAEERWKAGRFTKEDRDFLDAQGILAAEWESLLAHQKEDALQAYKNAYKTKALAAIMRLYQAFASLQEPVLGTILENYPEPTRSRDELLETVIKARKLKPGQLSHLEAHKSYRMPNPLRIAEKHMLDLAMIQLRKFTDAEKVDILLHMAKVQRLDADRLKKLNQRVITGERKKLARDLANIKSLSQLESYMGLMHRKDRSLLIRAMFAGDHSLHRSPAEVRRLFRKLVIEGRDLPAFVVRVLETYFEILTEDERARLIAEIAAIEDVPSDVKGPEIVRVALKLAGVTGAKVAQVLSNHKALIPEKYSSYTRGLEEFKDRAQDMEKARAHGLIEQRMADIAGEMTAPVGTRYSLEDLEAISQDALPSDNKDMSLGASSAARRRLVRQVRFLLKEQGRRARWMEAMGPELGAGSIKLVYKVKLDDGKTWVVKLRAPGAAYRTEREFEIIDGLIAGLQESGDLDLPGVGQLVEEVKLLVQAEMDFRSEAAKEHAMRERVRRRPWYARLVAPRPYVPKPHPLYVGEDLMIEEFVPTTRFQDLPRRSLIGPSKASIARRTVREGMFELVFNNHLEPDPHTGNRHARSGGLYRFFTKLLVMDIGQEVRQPIEPLKPMMKAAVALQAGDEAGATELLLGFMNLPPSLAREEALAAIRKGIADNADEGVVERMMAGLVEAEKLGALVGSQYAALQKAFVIFSDQYSEYLPKDYILDSLQRAAMARLWRDRAAPRRQLMWLGIRKLVLGVKGVRPELEALIDGLRDPSELKTGN